MIYRIYVIRDNGSEETCLPFFVQNDIVAKRQFAATLRTLPPSCRSDFQLEFIGMYDTEICELRDSAECEVISTGADDDIVKMMDSDAPFYVRGNIDRAPVSAPISAKDGAQYE